jgi:adenylate kinase
LTGSEAVRLRALLIAPPGAGKGTQADRITAHFGVTHISTGDMFREAVRSGTPLGRKVAVYLDAGDLVPDDLVGAVVRDAVLAAIEQTGGYLLDGFPRTLPQAEAAHTIAVELGITAQVVLTFEVPRAVLLERLMTRASSEGRSDDNERTIRHRLDVYDHQTAPLLDYYRGLGVLVCIDADRPVDEVTAVAITILEASLEVREDAT